MRLALLTINPIIGDLAGNAALIAAGLDHARTAGADLAVFPELALSGYPPRDLLLREGFVDACSAAAEELGRRVPPGLTAVFGAPLPRPGGGVTNSLLAFRDGRRVDRYDKRLLPTYDVFDEDRYFEPGERPCVLDVAGTRVGLAICEDLWRGEDAGFAARYARLPDPVAELVAAGARLIVSPSASPFVLGKRAKHRAIVRAHAARHDLPVASLNQLGGHDDLVFDGHAFVEGPRGTLAMRPMFSAAPLVVDPSEAPDVAPGRDAPDEPPDERLLFDALVTGVRDYLRKTGFREAILGLSGGIDSALTAALAVAALGHGAVLGISMPGRYSSEGSRADARDLAARLSIRCREIPIDAPWSGFHTTLDDAFTLAGLDRLGARLPDIAEENLQSRVRGTLLMSLSNRTGAIVLTTGNKSELAVGYCTLYGDMNGGLAVLSDVSKTWVYRLSRWINTNWAACGFASPPIPDASITKAPSAELRPDQTDQDTLPPYDVLDEILARRVEAQQSVSTIARETGFDPALVARIARLVDVNEFKRRQAALGLKVTTVAFGPGRRMPIVNGYRA